MKILNHKRIEYDEIFRGEIAFPILFGGIRPDIKNHIGAPEAFYSGQIRIFIGGGIKFNKQNLFWMELYLLIIRKSRSIKIKVFLEITKS